MNAEEDNPLNAKDYILAGNSNNPDTQFFNYVVLGYAYMNKDSRGYTHLEMTSALRFILDNSITYIKPLQLRGIQALIEVRSGNFRDDEDGAGAGFGTMDVAAIDEFIKELKMIINKYGIDGFDFNDIGGGKNSYPPNTRRLKQFQKDEPLYPDSMFKKKDGQGNITGEDLDGDEIERILWIEGGSNFSNLIQRTNESLKETYTSVWENGSSATDVPSHVERSILVQGRNHGNHLLSQLRMAYMPDAYSGADPKTTGNLKYIVHDIPYNSEKLHPSLWDEAQQKDVGAIEADNKYAPFAINLADQKDSDTLQFWAKTFLLKDPVGSLSDQGNQNRYGALYFTGLRPASASDSAGCLTCLSQELFGRVTRLADTPRAGDYKKTW
ncbi:MAG: hypothetical protein LBE17_03675 [Treponema sp.]|nr:hypothetical protein [Treponema sp.]